MTLTRLPAAFSLIIWAAIWELVGRYGGIDLIPPLSQIFAAAIELATLSKFHKALALTGEAFAIGLGLAILIGIPAGIFMGLSRVAANMGNLWVNIFISAPLSAFVPALMPLLGIGQTTVVATVFLFSVWVILIDTQAGIRTVNRSLVDMARSFGATRWQIYYKVMFLAALPEILTGLRRGVIRGARGVIIGQLIVALIGFGELFDLYLGNFLMDRFWALVFIIFGLAFVLVQAMVMLEQKFEFYAGVR